MTATDIAGLVRGVRLVFLAVAAFAAAGGWLVGHPLPFIVALVIAGRGHPRDDVPAAGRGRRAATLGRRAARRRVAPAARNRSSRGRDERRQAGRTDRVVPAGTSGAARPPSSSSSSRTRSHSAPRRRGRRSARSRRAPPGGGRVAGAIASSISATRPRHRRGTRRRAGRRAPRRRSPRAGRTPPGRPGVRHPSRRAVRRRDHRGRGAPARGASGQGRAPGPRRGAASRGGRPCPPRASAREVLGQEARGQGDDRDGVEPRRGLAPADLPRDGRPVQPGHHRVEQDEVERLGLEQGERRRAVGRGRDVEAVPPEQDLGEAPVGLAVVDDEDAQRQFGLDRRAPASGVAHSRHARRRPGRAVHRRARRLVPNARETAMTATEVPAGAVLDADELQRIDAWWRAANYLSVGQIYLLDNPLLPRAAAAEHVKPRLLGHWGTTPGLNLIYAHMNRVIRRARPRRDLRHRPRARRPRRSSPTPGSRGPTARSTRASPATRRACGGCSASSRSRAGSRATSRPRRPGSIHEGGELGYALSHAYGAAFDNPDLLVCCVVGDGEAETGPLATSWHSNKFLDPARDGAVLPILHLNGYKIANPTVLARIPRRRAGRAAGGLRLRPYCRRGRRPGRGPPAARRRRWTPSSPRSRRSSERRARRRAPSGRAGR